jgi:hypothetical protein
MFKTMKPEKMKKLSKERRDLLIKLELLIGGSMYNGNIQNYSSWGNLTGTGREYKYPITYLDENNKKISNYVISKLQDEELITGHYVLGGNHLHIMRALVKVLDYLEENNDLKIQASTNLDSEETE